MNNGSKMPSSKTMLSATNKAACLPSALRAGLLFRLELHGYPASASCFEINAPCVADTYKDRLSIVQFSIPIMVFAIPSHIVLIILVVPTFIHVYGSALAPRASPPVCYYDTCSP